jgi:hypothetical protein
MQSINQSKSSVRKFTRLSSALVIGVMTTFAVIPQVYAVSNAAGTSYAVRNTTKSPTVDGESCTADQCIFMSSAGVVDNENHGIFVKNVSIGVCYSPSGGSGQFVMINSAMTSTAISTLIFDTVGSSSYCTTANTWHIFKTTVITPNTIWAVKLDASANLPTTLDATNFKQCDPAGNFNITTGCTPLVSPPPVNAPIDLNMNKPVETFATEIEIK